MPAGLIGRRADIAVIATPSGELLVPSIVVIRLIVTMSARTVRGKCSKRCAADDGARYEA